MRRWQLAGLILGVGALFVTARPAQAQVWIGPRPVVVAPPPVVFAPQPVWVAQSPVWVSQPPVVVNPGWSGRPYWGARRYYRPVRRGGWYASGPRGRVVARRW
jgi:hypothetical protein